MGRIADSTARLREAVRLGRAEADAARDDAQRAMNLAVFLLAAGEPGAARAQLRAALESDAVAPWRVREAVRDFVELREASGTGGRAAVDVSECVAVLREWLDDRTE